MDVMDSLQKFASKPNWYHDSILKKYDAIDYVQLKPVREIDLISSGKFRWIQANPTV